MCEISDRYLENCRTRARIYRQTEMAKSISIDTYTNFVANLIYAVQGIINIICDISLKM